ncbi:MAG: xanthine dehydrogenase family protein molybdopterin-binding subunit [Planctomycetota bacterium]
MSERASERARGAEALTWGDPAARTFAGQDSPRVDGPLKVTGRARYTHDVRLPGMLYGAILPCPYPKARPALDLAPARALAGVVAAIELDESRDGGWTTYLGQPIAAVAAKTPELAADAIRAIGVEYELGDWCADRAQALAEGAEPVSSSGNAFVEDAQGDRAAVEAALAACDAVVEATYTMPVQVHACMETHGAVVDYRGGDEAIVYASTQGTNSVPGPAARALGLAAGKVTAIVEHMGGGFGSKLRFGVAGLAACRLAREAGAPVHLMLDRSDEFLCTGNRSGSHQVLKGGATADGKLQALLSTVQNLGGIGRGSHPGHPFIYEPAVSFHQPGYVLTHTDAAVPMRAPGHPQASFAIESMMDELANALRLDPLEFRKQNVSSEVYRRQLDRAAREIGWAEHPNRRGPPAPSVRPEKAVGIGFGLARWGGGGRPGARVTVRIASDGSVTASAGSQDLGTGTRTYLAGIVAEELGLPLAAVEARLGDSRYGPAGASGGSTTTPSLAPAVKDAARRARDAFFAHLAPILGTRAERLRARDGAILAAEDGAKRLGWREACATLAAGEIAVTGEFQAELADSGTHGAQAAKVEVDTLTGEVRVLKMVAVQDCGLAVNTLAARSQIQGGMIGALSYGLLEERVIDPWLGLAMNASFVDYKVAGIKDVAELVAILDDDPRERVIGIGEPPAIPGHAAIANAIFNACGARVRDLPLTPDKVLTALAALG